MFLQALSERWGPLPAGVWILFGAAALYWYARGTNRGPTPDTFDVPTEDAPGPSTPEVCCAACGQLTPNRLLGLINPTSLPMPHAPTRSLIGG